jgi:two-component system nitrate/nitrite response regulator NarL
MSVHSLNGHRLIASGERAAPVAVFPICASPLLRAGLEKTLTDVGFAVHRDMIDEHARLPEPPAGASVLFVIDASGFAEGAVDLIMKVRAHVPEAKIVLLADHFDPSLVSVAWKAGADGFCLTTHPHDVFVKSLELVMLGESILPSRVALAIATGYEADAHLERGKLSHREVEILVLLKDGSPNKVIARKLNLSEATVKVHIKAILRKVGVCNRTQAALWARRYAEVELAAT